MKKRVFKFIEKTYGIQPDYPFKDEWAESAVFRHPLNRKWFALFMNIEYSKLGINKPGRCDILNLKAAPYDSCFLREKEGILPAYHMSKTHWNTILLDGTVPYNGIYDMVEASYNLTQKHSTSH